MWSSVRCLVLYDARLYDPDRDLGVHLGAKPVADWLCGDEVNWKTLNLKTLVPLSGGECVVTKGLKLQAPT
jgi:hypothetical protein|tara:strand:- start:125 stop:337 length:213 start_codon:yes stop_codon:yes gene_type:complete